MILKNNEKEATQEIQETITEFQGAYNERIHCDILMNKYGSKKEDCEKDYEILKNPDIEHSSDEEFGGGSTHNYVQSGGRTYKENIDSINIMY